MLYRSNPNLGLFYVRQINSFSAVLTLQPPVTPFQVSEEENENKTDVEVGVLYYSETITPPALEEDSLGTLS